ncbi:FAD-dependent oxidoreductase [Erythrobacter aureus]|uniref:FAD-dependent oxidoreductase n=1 Tax=Erythrobacter aureus TaxID=2182384 RepID=UPI003A8D651D
MSMRKTGPVLLLVGGGHAHLGVLADWVKHGSPRGRTILVTPHRHARYSGMIPGTVAGEYAIDEGTIDLAALAKRAGAELVLDRCTAIEPSHRSIETEKGSRIAFDYCSIDIGAVARAREVLGEDPRLLDVRPIASFISRLSEKCEGAGSEPNHIAVIGGGAGGVELAFAVRCRFEDRGTRVTLVAGEAGLLDGFSRRAKALAERALRHDDIALVEQDARLEAGRLVAGMRTLEPVDLLIASLGGAAPAWPGRGGLAVSQGGFIAVDRHQRSVSHPHILAAGDIAMRQDKMVPRSGVHAVHSGPVLASNLRRLLGGGGAMRSYRPRPASLYLVSTADGKAIASYGIFAAHGRWAGWLKRWIDTRWIASFAKLSGRV